ncbi:hypothetical protein BC834DRAFT_409323 [Gloeopeniophorella convolvens]|nr:hypothetical protein BC834DRAFT_409323 [Gloeopeniophorella convolvens]
MNISLCHCSLILIVGNVSVHASNIYLKEPRKDKQLESGPGMAPDTVFLFQAGSASAQRVAPSVGRHCPSNSYTYRTVLHLSSSLLRPYSVLDTAPPLCWNAAAVRRHCHMFSVCVCIF